MSGSDSRAAFSLTVMILFRCPGGALLLSIVWLAVSWLSLDGLVARGVRGQAQALPPSADVEAVAEAPALLDLDSDAVDNSPVLQRWLQQTPDIADQIRHDPSFRTRLRLGYARLDDRGGVIVGVEDVFVGNTGLTVSADYSQHGQHRGYGAEMRYYLLPLGDYVNVTPVVGYRALETVGEETDGVTLGVRLMLALSRTGAADVAISQRWIAPGSGDAAGLTNITVGYAVTQQLRVGSEFQWQTVGDDHDHRVGLVLEWMP